MWDLERNRGAVVLISVLSGCVFVYNVWGPILFVTISLFIVVYACYSLIVNDSLLSPHAYHLLNYSKEAILEIRQYSIAFVEQFVWHLGKIWKTATHRYRDRFTTTMERRRRSNYQLSTDSYSATTRNSPKLDLIGQLSPIPRTGCKNIANQSASENSFYESGSPTYHRNNFGKHSSTPLFPHERNSSKNGELEFFKSARNSSKKMSPMYSQHHTLTRGENTTYFSPEGSPWGTSISPKMRAKASGVKTVQTVAGPLLASTRYNIDPKVYSDVTSPGLTTRLTKYATEANTKLTHQSQYCTGQFPKVNLHAGPIPLLNAKSVKMRSPVTVRVAPPDVTRYSPPSRQQVLSNICHMENKSPSSVVQVLREISLKRHASREDVATDLAKKQRTDGVVSDEFETQDEMKQKRSRDESSKSEEDTSLQNKTVRPTKRTKTPSCYDILNSLSSSIHIASGVKRKAVDFSRSGTPDFEKHFKSTESPQVSNIQSLTQHNAMQIKEDSKEKPPKQSDKQSLTDKILEHTPTRGILKISNKIAINNIDSKNIRVPQPDVKCLNAQQLQSVTCSESVKLTDKLFMRAEPQRNEKLKLLIEEQGNIKPKFTSDDAEEIKKEDIINMRQTSMKARLQSMFDAISGKTASKINPDVVIQAEDIATTKSPVCPVTCATLNSSTTTTNVNTTPISTSAILPVLSPAEQNVKPTKHVTFNTPSTEPTSPPIASNPVVSATKLAENPMIKPVEVVSKSNTASTSLSGFVINSTSNMNAPSSTPTSGGFAFDKPSVSTTSAIPVTSNGITFGTVVSSGKSVPTITSTAPTVSTTPGLFGDTTAPSPLPFSTSSIIKSAPSPVGTNTSQPVNSVTGTGFMFGAKPMSPISSSATVPTSTISTQNTTNVGTTATLSTASTFPSPINTTSSTSTTSGMLLFKSPTSTVAFTPPTVTTSNSPASVFTFGNKTVEPAKSEGMLAFGSSGSNVQNANIFGSTTTVQQTLTGSTATNTNFGSSQIPTQNSTVANTTASSTSGFGVSTTPSLFAFGTTAPLTSNKPEFSFSANPSVTTTATSLTGISTSTVTFPTNSIANTTFGTSSTFPTVQFGTSTSPSTTVATTVLTSTPIFGSSTSAPLFGTATSQPLFGSSLTSGTPSAFSIPKTTAAPLFGSNIGSTIASSTNSIITTPIFGSATAPSSTTTTTSTPIFSAGGNMTTPAITSSSRNLFSNVNGTTSATTSTGVFKSNGNIFGQSKPRTFNTGTTGFGSSVTPLFGSQATTAPATFGTTTNTTSSVAAPTFSSTNTSGFGSRSIVSGTQNPTTQAFGTTTRMFGTNSTPGTVFESTTSAFSSTPNAFGQAPPNLSFGTAGGTAPTFENNKPTVQTSATPAFGTPASTTSAFGTVNTNSGASNTSNIFTFGVTQKPPQQSTFVFGSNNTSNNAPTSSTTPFQFNTTTLKPATGFNFSAPSSTPSINFGTSGTPAFSAPTPEMFNIGSGSTTPRSRSVRTRKPR